MPVVSNTSPISNLAWISRVDLLADQFGEVWIPKAVELELLSHPDARVRRTIDEAKRREWLRVGAPSDAALVSFPMVELHPGEAEAIALPLR